MTKKIETGLLIRAQRGLDGVRQHGGLDAIEFGDSPPQQSRLLVAETLQRGLIELRGMEQGDLLRRRTEAVEAEIGHRFVRGLHGSGVQLDPAMVRQPHKSSRGRLQTLQIGRCQFHPFPFPFGGD